MVKNRSYLVAVAILLLVLASACGGSAQAKTSTPKPAAVFKATLSAPSHKPRATKPWPITVKVTNASGKPIAATLRMNVLFGGAIVGKVDSGKVYRFVGRHHEVITWPKQSIGYALTFQAVVTVKGKTKKLDWPLKVRK
jgi:hypothetical protein